MTESSYVKNGNFREYFYCAGEEFCSLETGIPGGLPGPDPRRGWENVAPSILTAM